MEKNPLKLKPQVHKTLTAQCKNNEAWIDVKNNDHCPLFESNQYEE